MSLPLREHGGHRVEARKQSAGLPYLYRLQLSVRGKRVISLLGLLALLCLAAGGYHVFAPARTPAGQLSLVDVRRSGFAVFENMFDDATDRVRVVALFSPT